MRLAIAGIALLATLVPATAAEARAERATETAIGRTAHERTALERTVREPVRFPLRRSPATASSGRPDRAERAPMPPVISGPFGAI